MVRSRYVTFFTAGSVMFRLHTAVCGKPFMVLHSLRKVRRPQCSWLGSLIWRENIASLCTLSFYKVVVDGTVDVLQYMEHGFKHFTLEYCVSALRMCISHVKCVWSFLPCFHSIQSYISGLDRRTDY